MREVAVLLGVSHQRVQQIAARVTEIRSRDQTFVSALKECVA